MSFDIQRSRDSVSD